MADLTLLYNGHIIFMLVSDLIRLVLQVIQILTICLPAGRQSLRECDVRHHQGRNMRFCLTVFIPGEIFLLYFIRKNLLAFTI